MIICPGGGTGRRAGFKIQFWKQSVGSSPTLGTQRYSGRVDMYKDKTKQQRYDKAYMKMALEWAHLSYCQRKQVGALIVKDNMIISDGYNGTPSGFENICELKNGQTKWYVLHAEANAILKCAKHGQSCEGADLYLTLSPCKECGKLIHQAGIARVIYYNTYKDLSGIKFLIKAGVKITHLTTETLYGRSKIFKVGKLGSK